MNCNPRFLCAALALLPLFAGDDPEKLNPPRNGLTNEGVVILSEAGYDEAFVADMILQKQTHFDVTVEGLAYLAKHGISDRVVRLMIANENQPSRPVAEVKLYAPPPPVAMRLRVLRQKVLIPWVKKRAVPPAWPVLPPYYSWPAAWPILPSYFPLAVGRQWYQWYAANPAPVAVPPVFSTGGN